MTQQPYMEYSKRQLWIIAEVERVVSYWRLCSPLSQSDIGTAVEVLEPYDTEVLVAAFKAVKKYDAWRITEKRAPGIRDIQDACVMVRNKMEVNASCVPLNRQLDIPEAERERLRKENDAKAQEFFRTMRAQLGIDKTPGGERSRSKDPMTPMGDLIPEAPEARKAAD